MLPVSQSGMYGGAAFALFCFSLITAERTKIETDDQKVSWTHTMMCRQLSRDIRIPIFSEKVHCCALLLF